MKQDYPFIEWRRRAYVGSLALLIVFAAITAMRGGFNYGLDFIGGTSVLVKFDQPLNSENGVTEEQLRSYLSPVGLGDNIRTVGATGGLQGAARSVSIEVRGSDWVDNRVQDFITARTAGGENFGAETIRESFSAPLQKEALDDLVANFLPVSTETGSLPLYNPATVRESELADIFQSIFNENISLSIQNTLYEALAPEGGVKPIDINNVGNAENLAIKLAELKAQALVAKITAASDKNGGARAWKSVDEFIALNSLQKFDGPSVRQRLYTDTAPRKSAISVITAPHDELIAVFIPSFKNRFQKMANILSQHRDKDFGGIYPSIDDAINFVPKGDLEARSLLKEHGFAGRFILASSETVGPSVGADLQKAAFQAILFSLLGIVLYVWFRFELRYGIGAVIALLHDSLLTIFFIGATGLEFSIPIVAAILTVIGYSINDTIVVYDRIREKVGKLKNSPDPALIDLAIGETLPRTIGTSTITLLATLTFLFFGPIVIRDLSIALSFGIILGTYSSIFVAAPVLVEWDFFNSKATKGPRKLPSKKKKNLPATGSTTSVSQASASTDDAEPKSTGTQRRGFPTKKKKKSKKGKK
ncbi:MAG: protein translocase subunit SecF [Candidatus Lindowbacteria bacterium]|nr:protein translocase subunit SecF [Candidatus Lindowbacteria bacterium]